MTSPAMSAEPELHGRSVFILNPSKRCQINAHLFTRLVKFFLVNGYRVADTISACDIVLVNSCCVNPQKLEDALAAVEQAKAHGAGKQIVLFGCLPRLPGSRLDRAGLICIGSTELDRLDSIFPSRISIRHISASRLPQSLFTPSQGLGYDDYYVLIAQGCSNRCSYCNINRSKGRVRSEPPEKIEAEIAAGLARGARQFALLADDCGSYGHDLSTDLARLMERLFALGDDFSLKLGYLYPGFLVNHFDALERLFATGRISFANIPVQSGSQRVLDLMNRRYPIGTVLETVRRLREVARSSRLCTHLLMNFPTETREEFLQTLAAAEQFREALFLHFSDNEGTAAASLVPKVPADEARRRWDLASDFANSRMPGRAFVITDFNCDAPYNVTRARGH